MKKNFSKMAMFAAVAIAGFTTTSCKRDDDNGGGGNTVKITLSIPNAEADDFISLSVAGGTSSGGTDNWKINGVVQKGQAGVGLGNNEFLGATKTYVIESTKAQEATAIGIQLINFDNPMNFTFKVEKGGTVVANESKTLTGNSADFTKQYNF